MRIRQHIGKPLRYAVLKTILRSRQFSVSDSIIVCSEPRSGSTWLMEILQKHPGTIVNWEPLHVELGSVPKSFNLGWRPYIASDDANREFHELFEKILTLKLISPWSVREITIADALKAQLILTKFARAVRLLPWFTEQFSLKRKPVYLLRHPISTSLSQEKHFPPVNMRNLRFGKEGLQFDELNDQHYGIFRDLAGQLEIRTALWSMYNSEVLQHPRHDKSWLSLNYENLVRDPQVYAEQLNSELDLQLPIRNIDFRRASRSDFKHDFRGDDISAQLTRWMDDLSHSQLSILQQILDYFKITTYSAFSPLPV